jgi:3-demethoxyubiquinol 3-hydroxylase
MTAALTPREALTIRRILKVNHAGEFGAIRIYRAQIWVARRFCPDIVPPLEKMLADEIEHCRIFHEAMPQRSASPCRIMSLWSWGGAFLGFVTALMGRQSIWITTAAVEEAVHHHMDDQLRFLETRDPELYKKISTIRDEELDHLQTAQEKLDDNSFFGNTLSWFISFSTDAAIWLSTWGDSTRMKRDLAAASERSNP